MTLDSLQLGLEGGLVVQEEIYMYGLESPNFKVRRYITFIKMDNLTNKFLKIINFQ